MTQIVMVLVVCTVVMCASAALLAVATIYTVRNFRALKAMEARALRRTHEPLRRESQRHEPQLRESPPRESQPRAPLQPRPEVRAAVAATAARRETESRANVQRFDSAPASYASEYSSSGSSIPPGEWTGPVMPYTPGERDTG